MKIIQLIIKDNSTFPLVIVEEKNDDQYLLEGIDVKDDVQKKKLEKMKEIQKKN